MKGTAPKDFPWFCFESNIQEESDLNLEIPFMFLK